MANWYVLKYATNIRRNIKLQLPTLKQHTCKMGKHILRMATSLTRTYTEYPQNYNIKFHGRMSEE